MISVKAVGSAVGWDNGRGGASVEALHRFIAESGSVENAEASLEWIDPRTIVFDSQLQRPTNKAALKRLVKSWDIALCAPITCSSRPDGSTVAVCGRHRTLAAIENGEDAIPALIFSGLTTEEEALVFLAEDNRVRISPYDRLRLRMEAGDEHAIRIGEIVSASPFSLSANSERKVDWHMSCITAVERVYRLGVLRGVLGILATAFNGDWRGSSGRIVTGLAMVIDAYGDHVDFERLSMRLGKVGPDGIDARAYNIKASEGIEGARCWAKSILGIYNDGLRAKRLNGGAL